jgi:HlyD family secretion protein
MSINTQNPLVLFFKKIVNRIFKKSGVVSILFFCVIGVFAYKYFVPTKVVAETSIVKLGQLKQYVSVTGSVQSSRDANLSFQTLGSVAHVGVKVGDIVSQGKILATLQSGDAEASLLNAQAQLASAEATLGQLTQGFRKEEVAVKQQMVDNAKNSLEQSYIALPDTIRNVDATTADVVKNKLNSLFVSNGDRYTLSFSSCDQNLQSSIESSRSKIETTLADYQKKSSVISTISQEENIDAVFELAYNATVETNTLVGSISSLLLAPCSSQNTSLDPMRVTLSSVRATMNALFLDITAKRGALNVAKNTLSQATRDLELTKAGTDPYKLKAQAALVSQAEAQVVAAKSGVSKTMIVAPFSGTISDISITEGETVTGGKTVISMLAIDAFEIEAKVPEVDVVKLKTGADVDVTLDAYGKAVTFPATVTRINPTATVEGSVPFYKVIITFTGKDVRIKSGMTANVNIVTESKTQAIILPSRFVQVKDEKNGTIILLKDGKETVRGVVLGVRGQDGLIEIVSGLVPGDEVVSPSTGIRSAQKQTN